MHLIIKKIIKQRGVDILYSKTLISCMDDEGAFSDIEIRPYKKILRTIVTEDYSQKLTEIGEWNAETEALARSFAQRNMLQEDEILYVFSCLAYGLGWLKKSPKLPAEAKKLRQQEALKKAKEAEAAQKANEEAIRQEAEDTARKKTEAAEKRAREAERRAAEAERKAKAAEMARINAEKDVRLQLATEERRKAEAEARIRAEEARKRAEENARIQAEEAARIKAEADAIEETQKKKKLVARRRCIIINLLIQLILWSLTVTVLIMPFIFSSTIMACVTDILIIGGVAFASRAINHGLKQRFGVEENVSYNSKLSLFVKSIKEKQNNLSEDERKMRFQKGVEISHKILGGLFLTVCVILIIVNAIYTYIESDSWLLCILAAVATFFIGVGELFFIQHLEENNDAEINTKSPDGMTVVHLIWRTIWVTGMIVLGEYLFIWLFEWFGWL